MKSKISKNNSMKFKRSKQKHLVGVLLGLIVVLLIIFQVVFDVHTHDLQSPYLQATPIITSLLNSGVNDLYKPAPVEAQTGQVYFPDIRLQLPEPSADLGTAQIEYNTFGSGSLWQLDITTSNLINQGEAKLLDAQANAKGNAGLELSNIFAQVPNLQACGRGMQLFSVQQNNNNSTLELRFTKVLQNGTHIYGYDESTCVENIAPLEKLVQNIQSY